MSGLQTLRDIVAEYQSEYQQHSEDKLEFFRVQRNLADAISSASLAQGPGGKRLAHQRRIPAAVLEEARMRLLEVMNRLKTAETFADLHQIVWDQLRDIRGIGKLTIYDTALRIASWRRRGARASISARELPQARKRSGSLALAIISRWRTYSKELTILKPRQVEDVLCIYKTEIRNLRLP